MKTAPNTPIFYKVRGRWSFPFEMIGHDNAAPASDADAALIKNLSDDHCPDGFNTRDHYVVCLLMSAGETGRNRPNYERWQSFGWQVIEELAGGGYSPGGQQLGGEVIGAYTPQTQAEWLTAHGYVVGVRDPRLNTKYRGEYMVAESFDDSELPTEDGSNGPWCIVGDDLDSLVKQAFDIHFPDYWYEKQIQAAAALHAKRDAAKEVRPGFIVAGEAMSHTVTPTREEKLEEYLRKLLDCCELNLDEMEQATVDLIDDIHEFLGD